MVPRRGVFDQLPIFTQDRCFFCNFNVLGKACSGAQSQPTINFGSNPFR